jgi:hypothetical protein
MLLVSASPTEQVEYESIDINIILLPLEKCHQEFGPREHVATDQQTNVSRKDCLLPATD